MKTGLDPTEIVSDPNGILLLIGANYLVNGNSGIADVEVNINIEDGLYIYLRIATASFYSELCHNPAAESVARLLIWKVMTQFGQEECRKVFRAHSSQHYKCISSSTALEELHRDKPAR